MCTESDFKQEMVIFIPLLQSLIQQAHKNINDKGTNNIKSYKLLAALSTQRAPVWDGGELSKHSTTKVHHRDLRHSWQKLNVFRKRTFFWHGQSSTRDSDRIYRNAAFGNCELREQSRISKFDPSKCNEVQEDEEDTARPHLTIGKQ